MVLNTPLALLGLLTLPVILALHALRARSERYVVSSLALWNFLDAQISGSRARRIPLTWLLALDLLIATLFTLALAQPELALTRIVPNARHIIVVLDVSTSMAATDQNPTRFARAQSDAADLLRFLSPLDTATLITFGTSAQILADTRTASLENLLTHLDALTPGETGANLDAALALANAAHDPALPLEIHLFTDAAYPYAIRNTEYALILHPYGTSANNQSVLTLAPSPLSAQKLQLFTRFANFADAPVSRRATLLADDTPIATADLTLDAHATLPYTWDIVGNPTRLTVQLEGSDTLPADDRASLGLNTPPALHVALVATDPAPVDRALAALPNITVQRLSPTDYLPGSPFDLVIFKDFLPSEKPTSNALILNPPGEPSPVDPTRIILQPHPFLAGLDFTGLRNLQRVASDLPPWLAEYALQTLLASESTPLLQHGQTGQTQTTILSLDLASGNFTQHPAFIILLNNLLAYYHRQAIPDQIPLGTPLQIPTGSGAEIIPNDDSASPPATCPCTFTPRVPGLYRLDLIDPGGTAQTHWIGVNAGALTESDITPNQWTVASAPPLAPATLEEPIPLAPATLEEPIPLAPYLLVLTIILLFAEAYLAWK